MTDTPTPRGKVPWRLTPEFVLGILFAADGVAAPVVGIPVSYVAVFVLIAVGYTRKATLKMGRWAWVGILLAALLAYVAIISSVSQPTTYASSWVRRAVRLVGVFLLVLHLARGRINTRILIVGATVGLFANVAAFYLKLAPDTYGGALTGFLADKNRAGMFYAVFGILVLGVTRRAGVRFVLAAAFAGLLWLTESRMSMTAYAAGIIWMLLIAKRHPLVRWPAAGALYWAISFTEENFARAGVFESRWGSDLLRGRIEAASDLKLAAAPWFGMGLGEAYVVLQSNTWYFHNSYASLLVEGGWPYLIGVLTITILIGLRPFHRGESAFERAAAAGATVAVLGCAWKLGEVFLTIPWAVAVGFALNTILAGERGKAPQSTDVEDVVPA